MKKYVVLGVLFILPIIVYLFFASGVNNFGRLSILQQKVENISDSKGSEGELVDLKGNITILTFLGEELDTKKLNAFNLNQKVYKRFNGFKDFQFVTILPYGTEDQAKALKQKLSSLTTMSNWHFIHASKEKIQSVFNSLQTPYTLNEKLYTPYAFIVDKDLNLRGRVKDETAEKELFGYDATSVAIINNKMIDDIKVLLAEYRLALKKNGDAPKRDSYLKYNKDEK